MFTTVVSALRSHASFTLREQMHFSTVDQMLAALSTLHHVDLMRNGVCSNEEPSLTFSAALDPAFGVREVTQHVVALSFASHSQW